MELVRVKSYDEKEGKIPPIRAIRAVTGWGLKEAKDFVETLPQSLTVKGIEQIVTLAKGGLDVEVTEVQEALWDILLKAARQALNENQADLAYDILTLCRKYDFF